MTNADHNHSRSDIRLHIASTVAIITLLIVAIVSLLDMPNNNRLELLIVTGGLAITFTVLSIGYYIEKRREQRKLQRHQAMMAENLNISHPTQDTTITNSDTV